MCLLNQSDKSKWRVSKSLIWLATKVVQFNLQSYVHLHNSYPTHANLLGIKLPSYECLWTFWIWIHTCVSMSVSLLMCWVDWESSLVPRSSMAVISLCEALFRRCVVSSVRLSFTKTSIYMQTHRQRERVTGSIAVFIMVFIQSHILYIILKYLQLYFLGHCAGLNHSGLEQLHTPWMRQYLLYFVVNFLILKWGNQKVK